MRIPRHLSMRALAHATGVVSVRLGPVAQMCLGLDDWQGLVAEAYPSLVAVREGKGNAPTTYRAELRDAAVLLDDLNERANPNPYGFDHTPGERAACARGAATLLAAMAATVPSPPLQEISK